MANSRAQWLTQGLLISGILNVALLVVCLNYAVKHKTIDTTGSLNTSSVEQMSFSDLKEALSDLDMRRDALACLVHTHDFDLTRALGGESALINELTEEQFKNVVAFSGEEEWPLTASGLFKRLDRDDETIVDAFAQTLEFLAVDALFADSPVNKHELVEIVTHGSWDKLRCFADNQRRTSVQTDGQRRRFLLSYVDEGSSKAAEIFVRTDCEHIVESMTDPQVLTILTTLKRFTPETGFLLVDLLLSPRGETVWQAAASQLYAFVDEPMPEPYNHRATLERFVPEDVLYSRPQPTLAQPTLHQVQRGDSLWAISRRYNVSVSRIRESNHLASDTLRPGQLLQIPAS